MAGLSSQQILLGDGDVVYPGRFGNLYAAKTFTSTDSTNKTTLFTGAPGYFITELGYHVDLNATIAAAGMVDIVFSDDQSGIFANFRVWIPTPAANPNTPTTLRQVNQGPLIWSNKVANSNMQVNLGTALTAQSIRVFVRYGRTNYLG